jgi:hypothetical protein
MNILDYLITLLKASTHKKRKLEISEFCSAFSHQLDLQKRKTSDNVIPTEEDF